jgi:uncharacterized protein (TIGR00255 family)
MIQSMTGFGAAAGRVGSARVSVEIRTVNHRFFSPNIKLPVVLARWEGEVREALRKRISRGHVSLSAWIEREQAGGASIDEVRFAAYVAQLRELQAKYGLNGELDVATILRMPDVISSGDREEDAGSAEALVAVVDEALAALSTMRGQEGVRLAAYLGERLDTVERALAQIAARAPARLVEARDRLRVAARELTEGLGVDEQRLSQEIALLADRLDVSEEMDRFRSHLQAFRSTLGRVDGEPVGKRLGFLLQEILREANTTGSKANDAAMQREVVAIKEELERIREQVENLE